VRENLRELGAAQPGDSEEVAAQRAEEALKRAEAFADKVVVSQFAYDPRMDSSVKRETLKRVNVPLPEPSNEAREKLHNHVMEQLGIRTARSSVNAKKLAQLRELDELQRLYEVEPISYLRRQQESPRSARSRSNKTLAFLNQLEQ